MLPQVLLDAADDSRAVGVSDFFRDHADGVGSLVAESPGEKIWPVVQFLSSGMDTVLRFLGDGTGRRCVVQNRRYGTGSKSNMLGNGFKCHHLRFLNRLSVLPHGSVRIVFQSILELRADCESTLGSCQ